MPDGTVSTSSGDSQSTGGGFNKGITYRDIVMSQLRRCVENSSKEMIKGFFIYNYSGPGHEKEPSKYVPDTRKQLMRSIDVLHDLIFPKFSQKMKLTSGELYTSIQELRKESREYIMPSDGSHPRRFMEEILTLYRQLFLEVCLFMETIGWLADESGED